MQQAASSKNSLFFIVKSEELRVKSEETRSWSSPQGEEGEWDG